MIQEVVEGVLCVIFSLFLVAAAADLFLPPVIETVRGLWRRIFPRR